MAIVLQVKKYPMWIIGDTTIPLAPFLIDLHTCNFTLIFLGENFEAFLSSAMDLCDYTISINSCFERGWLSFMLWPRYLCKLNTVEPLLWGHPFCIRKVAFQEGWPLVRGKNRYIYVYIYIAKWPFQREWPLVRVASQKGFHCTPNW